MSDQRESKRNAETANVLVLGPLVPDMIEPISAFANPVPYWKYGSVAECRAACGGDFRALASTGESVVARDFLAELPSLEVIVNYGVGYDGIDMDAVSERGVKVSNTPDVLTEDVADLAIVFAIALRRRIIQADRYVRDGKWESDGVMPYTDRFHGKRVGIAGLGRIGRAVGRRLEGFGARIGYFDVMKFDVPYQYHASLVALARESDILIVTMPGGSKTRGAIGAEVLSALGAEGSLVNVSRGSVVDEPALVEALQQGQIAAAALDVFASEPRVPEALKSMPNVILSPHTASGTWETRNAMRDLVVENLRNWLQGRPLVTAVN